MALQEEGRFDEAFLPVLTHLGKMDLFLDHLFSFLYRRTDFYHVMKTKNDRMGFPPGAAERMVTTFFKKYQQLSKLSQQQTTSSKEKASDTQPSRSSPSTKSDVVQMADRSSTVGSPAKSSICTQTKKPDEPTISSSDSYNGSTTDRYTWSQSLTDVDMKIPLPAGTKASQLSVDIQSSTLKVRLRNDKQSEPEILLEGSFFEKVKCEESIWSKDGDVLHINLEKTRDVMWKSVLKGDDEIDLSKVDATRDMSEFDEETQGGVRKVMYDYHQKMQGKPTSDEEKTLAMLEKAWDAEGSPFKGTPFDPSRVNIGAGSSFMPPSDS